MTTNKRTWTIIRTIGFIIVGLFNTVFIKPEDVGTWKNYVGYAFLELAVLDIFFLIKPLLIKRNEK